MNILSKNILEFEIVRVERSCGGDEGLADDKRGQGHLETLRAVEKKPAWKISYVMEKYYRKISRHVWNSTLGN